MPTRRAPTRSGPARRVRTLQPIAGQDTGTRGRVLRHSPHGPVVVWDRRGGTGGIATLPANERGRSYTTDGRKPTMRGDGMSRTPDVLLGGYILGAAVFVLIAPLYMIVWFVIGSVAVFATMIGLLRLDGR